MMFAECCKWPLRKLSVKGLCFMAKSNQTDTETQLISTCLKFSIAVYLGHKETHTFRGCVRRCSPATPSFSSTTPVMRTFVPLTTSRRLHGDTCLWSQGRACFGRYGYICHYSVLYPFFACKYFMTWIVLLNMHIINCSLVFLFT